MTEALKRKMPIFLLIGLFVISSIGFLFHSETVDSKETEETIPTVFIHGFSGNEKAFEGLISRFESNNWIEKGLSIHVSEQGELSIRGVLKGKQNPVVHVVFADNHASVAKQTEWVSSVMTKLADSYQVSSVNIVGHSMGGLASVSYLLNNQDNPLPKVEKLITIGSPFLGIERERYAIAEEGSGAYDLQWNSPAIQKMAEKYSYFDEETLVLNLAGVIEKNAELTGGSDGLVTLESTRGLMQIVPAASYHEQVFYDEAATHVGLHEFEEADKTIAAFLWNIQ